MVILRYNRSQLSLLILYCHLFISGNRTAVSISKNISPNDRKVYYYTEVVVLPFSVLSAYLPQSLDHPDYMAGGVVRINGISDHRGINYSVV